jgi:hypothetical protein
MAFQNIDQLQLGNLLQILFTNGVRMNISQDFRDFEMIRRAKAGSSLARELRFALQTSLGPSAIQYRNPGETNRAFPAAQRASVSEYTAKFKEIAATIELEYNLWERASKSPEKYAEPLALEIDSKTSSSKRRLAADLYGDGTGVVGTIASQTVVNNDAVVTLSSANAARGHVGFFEFGDLIVHYAANGGAGSSVTVGSGTFSHWRILDKDRDNNTVTLQAVNTAGADVATSSWSPTAGEVFYRIGQNTIPDLTSISDYGTVSEVMAGLESLVASDGRTVHGMVMSGALGGSRVNAGGNPIDVKYIEKVMNKVKIAAGQDRYKWKMMCMSPETHSSFVESRETDRRFQTVDDNKRGVKVFAYIHGNDTLECYTSEYVPQKRVYILPEAKNSDKVIEFHGSDFSTVKQPGGSDFLLKPYSSGGYSNMIVSYLQSTGVYICKHPSSVAIIENFTNS